MISVIVPVYNVEKEIERCINSLLNQTIKNYEIILIDDGSTDRSGMICDLYSDNYQIIKVIHINNGGVSNARNVGIEASEGEYLTFCDSDDYVECDYLERLLIDECDLSICSCMFCNEDGIPTKSARIESDRIEEVNRNSLSKWFFQGSLYSVWGCLFRKEIIERIDLRFDVQTKRGEDTLFMLEYVLHCKCVRFIKKALYYYVRYDKPTLSTTLDIGNISSLSYLDAKLDKWFKKNHIDAKNFYNSNFWTKRELKEQFIFVFHSSLLSIKEKFEYYDIFCKDIVFKTYRNQFFLKDDWKFRIIVKLNNPYLWVLFDLCFGRKR